MSPTRTLLALSALGFLSFIGCAGDATATAPTVAAPVLTTAYTGATGVMGSWQVTLDPDALTADVTFSRDLAAQPPQNLSYQLDIADFLAPRDFQVTRVRRGLGNALEVDWRQRHPFPAPQVANPIAAKNRADLGYTGYLVLLSDAIRSSFFESSVTAATTEALNPDVYVPVGDLIADGRPESRVFPAWLIVDEDRDSRGSTSNNGVMTGSYDVANGGWQLGNLGSDGLGWTGFDYLHGGEASTGTMRFALPPASGRIDLTLALLVKWTDPRGMGGPERRLPVAPFDVTQFAYRLPYAALDASQFIVPGLLELDATGSTETPFAVALRDWDAQASEAAGTNLGSESDVSLIQTGASGAPAVDFSFPPRFEFASINPESGTGEPRDPLRYAASLDPGILTPSLGWGMVRAIDPEDDDPAANTYRFGVEPGTLAPSADRALPIRTYQLVRTLVANPSGELLFATQTPGLTAGASARLVQLLPGPVATVPGSDGALYGTAMAELLSPMAGQFLVVSPGGGLSSLERTPDALRMGRPLQDAFYAHPSAAWRPVANFPGTQPFLAISGQTTPQLVLGDFLTGQQLAAFPSLPKPLPSLTVSGQGLYADLGGPDWDQSNAGRAAIALGTGIEVAVALPPLKANGNLYTFDPGNPAGSFTKLTNLSDSSTTEGVFYPDWSPDGTKLVVTRVQVNIINIPSSFKLAIVDAATGNMTNLNLSSMGTPPAPATAYIPIQPVFNRDGTKIAFAALEVSIANQTISDSDIWVLDLSGPTSQLTNVSNTDGVFEAYPVFR